MSIISETLLVPNPSVARSKRRLFTVTYLCAIAVAMIGWCMALVSGAVSLAHWLF